MGQHLCWPSLLRDVIDAQACPHRLVIGWSLPEGLERGEERQSSPWVSHELLCGAAVVADPMGRVSQESDGNAEDNVGLHPHVPSPGQAVQHEVAPGSGHSAGYSSSYWNSSRQTRTASKATTGAAVKRAATNQLHSSIAQAQDGAETTSTASRTNVTGTATSQCLHSPRS